MAGLALFLFAFLRLIRTGQASDAFVAGCGLSFAMLCRPLTAAAFALPFGLSFACRIFGATKLLATASTARILLTSATLGAPLLLGLAVLFLYDKAITGDGFRTPYQLYTVIYTPRHVYGFNNVARGEQRIGPKVMDAYDRWAKNLTPQLAVENVAARTFASAQWTLGPVPLAMAAVVFVLAASGTWIGVGDWSPLRSSRCTRPTCPIGSPASWTGTMFSRRSAVIARLCRNVRDARRLVEGAQAIPDARLVGRPCGRIGLDQLDSLRPVLDVAGRCRRRGTRRPE